MNPEIKQKWIEALESGEYEQGQGGLRIRTEDGPDQFCCLGVLADIINPDEWRPPVRRWYKSKRISSCPFNEGDSLGYLPDNIAEEVGLSREEQIDFASMNDEGKNFREIAEEIRKRV